jgi:hypothetical protein
MRKLRRDKTTAEQRDSFRQLIALEKVGAGQEMLLAIDAEAHRHGAGGNQHKAALELVGTDRDSAGAGKPGAAVESIDAASRKALFLHWRHGFGEAALERDQRAPIDNRFAPGNAFATHPTAVIDRFRGADQHLLWVAATQGTRTPER